MSVNLHCTGIVDFFGIALMGRLKKAKTTPPCSAVSKRAWFARMGGLTASLDSNKTVALADVFLRCLAFALELPGGNMHLNLNFIHMALMAGSNGCSRLTCCICLCSKRNKHTSSLQLMPRSHAAILSCLKSEVSCSVPDGKRDRVIV